MRVLLTVLTNHDASLPGNHLTSFFLFFLLFFTTSTSASMLFVTSRKTAETRIPVNITAPSIAKMSMLTCRSYIWRPGGAPCLSGRLQRG